jgi:hypothetical protein
MASWISHANSLADAREVNVGHEPPMLCGIERTWPSRYFAVSFFFAIFFFVLTAGEFSNKKKLYAVTYKQRIEERLFMRLRGKLKWRDI